MIFDAPRFLKEFNISHVFNHPKVSNGYVGFCCPFCHDQNYKAAFNVSIGYATCWVCGKLNTIETIEMLVGGSRNEARRIFGEYLTDNRRSGMERQPRSKGTATQVSLPDTGSFTRKEDAYLVARGLRSRADQYSIRGGGVIGKWAFRIVFPITLDGNIVSATGRTIANVEPRYLTLAPHEEIVTHKSLLLNEDKVRGNHIVLVEGVIDSIRGGPGFVASFGLSLTEEQIMRLTGYRKISILPDSEEKAWRAWNNLGDTLCALGMDDVEIVKQDMGKDIGDMSEDEIVDLRREVGL